MWLGRLLGDGGDFDLFEAGFFEEAVQGVFFETQPDVGVEFTGLFESVALEVKNQDLAAGTKDAAGFIDCFLRVLGVVQRLAENGKINRTIGQRDGFYVAKFINEIGKIVLSCEFGADFDHARGIVDAPDVGGPAREKLRDEAFASAEIGDCDGGCEAQR